MVDHWELYFKQIEEFFPVVTGKKVLELASMDGMFWPHILMHNPLLLEGLDPANIKYKSNSVKVHKVGYQDFLPNNNYDVIVCFGLIYKLSNPLDLLERIANSNPTHVIFEQINPYNADVVLKYYPEKYNLPGQLVVDKSYRRVPWSLLIPVPVIVEAFRSLGYELIKYKDTDTPGLMTKRNTCVLLLQKI